MFSLAYPDGYLCHAEPYCGADTQLSETSFGLGGNIVLFFSQVCDVPVGSRFHFDNWFTSIPSVDRLKVDGIGETGTIRADRCGKVPLAPKAELENQKRGSMFYACDGSNMIVRWCGNAIVPVASSCQLSNSSRLVSRWSMKQKKRVDVPMSHMIHLYNRCMGGVDLFDQFVVIRSKK